MRPIGSFAVRDESPEKPASQLIFWLLLGILIFTFIATIALAQDASTGAIRGTVSDPAGARLPAANVVAVNLATGFRYAIVTNGDGAFSLELLPPGEYSLRVETPGM